MAVLTRAGFSETFRLARASRYSSPESPADILPYPYGDLTAPARSASGVYRLPKIDTAGNGTYCVSAPNHAIKGEVSIFDDGGLISPAGYTLNLSDNFQGKGQIGTVSGFTTAPAGIVTAVCKGKTDAGGALIEDPIRIVEDIFLNLWGYRERDLNRRMLERAAGVSAAHGFIAAGLLNSDRAPQNVLNELLGDFLGGANIDADGRLRVRMPLTSGTKIRAADVMPERQMDETECVQSIISVVNRVDALYAKNYVSGSHILHDDGTGTQDAASQRLYGDRPASDGGLSFEWIRGAAVMNKVQALIVESHRRPARILTTLVRGIRTFPYEEGDFVAFTARRLRTRRLEPMVNQIGEVMEVTPDLQNLAMRVRLKITDIFLTTACPLDGSKTLDGSFLLGAERDLANYA